MNSRNSITDGAEDVTWECELEEPAVASAVLVRKPSCARNQYSLLGWMEVFFQCKEQLLLVV